MQNRKYRIAGGDDMSYGPSFGPVEAEETGDIAEGWGGPYLLLRLFEPIIFQGELVEHLAIAPRYVGDDLDTIRNSLHTTISFLGIRPGMLELAKAGIDGENAKMVAVGGSELLSNS